MPTLQVAWNPTTRVATVALDGTSVPAGSTKRGTFVHPDPVYPDSKVIFHGVQDILYKTKPSNPPVDGFFPDNITDMQRVEIVYVPPTPVASVTVSPTTASIVVGATRQLTPTVNPSGAANKTVAYTSSNTGVTTVSSSGLVTAVAVGSATITVETNDGGFTATCAVTVTAE